MAGRTKEPAAPSRAKAKAPSRVKAKEPAAPSRVKAKEPVAPSRAKAPSRVRTRKKPPTAPEEPVRKELWEITKPNVGGRPRLFEDADALLKACMGYFQWIKDNPLLEEKVFNFQGRITRTHVTKMRAMTLGGLQLHAHVSHGQWSKWRDPRNENDYREDLFPVMVWAEETIREQKFTGAAADLLNATIISRDLGMAEKNEHSGPAGGPIQTEVSARDILLNRINAIAGRRAADVGAGESDEQPD